MDSVYFKQVQLLVQLLPLIAKEPCFALKGGTGINLFVRNMPRLSVDIDLVYLPLDDRETALIAIREALDRIVYSIESQIHEVRITKSYHQRQDALRVIVRKKSTTVKIELSPVLRGTIFEPRMMSVVQSVEDMFGYAHMPVVSFEDLYAGKICAALDRQHPRDLFDIKFLLENEGISDLLRKAVLVYLVSHNKPFEELLSPRFKDLSGLFNGEFAGMTQEFSSIIELERTREQLVKILLDNLTKVEKEFLCGIYELRNEVVLLESMDVYQLPAVQWKIRNVAVMPNNKREKILQDLKKILNM